MRFCFLSDFIYICVFHIYQLWLNVLLSRDSIQLSKTQIKISWKTDVYVSPRRSKFAIIFLKKLASIRNFSDKQHEKSRKL